MTTLTADELDTFGQVFGHELTKAQMEHLEEWVATHRDEAVVTADLSTLGTNGSLRVAIANVNMTIDVLGWLPTDVGQDAAEVRDAFVVALVAALGPHRA